MSIIPFHLSLTIRVHCTAQQWLTFVAALLLGLTLACQAMADNRPLTNPREDQIDVGIAALSLAKEFYPNLDVEAYSARIDVLADKVRMLAKGTPDPEQRIRALNAVFFQQEGFHYDHDPLARNKEEHYFLNGILDSKQGICYTMPLLYVAIAQRLGYPIYPVAVPEHMFVRYVESTRTRNIEVTSGGKTFPDSKYIEDFAISTAGIRSGSYLHTLSYREFLGHMIAGNAFIQTRRGHGRRSIAYLERAIQLDPQFADHYANLAMTYQTLSQVASKDVAERDRQKAAEYLAKTKALGYVSSEEVEFAQKLRGR